ncbi:MAG: triose-phosphate isomerase [Pseudomonadota bacterium]
MGGTFNQREPEGPKTVRKLIAGNWKMNGLVAEAEALAREVRTLYGEQQPFDMLVAPPATALSPVAASLSGSQIGLAGQNCHAAPSGAHTGDISADMLKDVGCSHVIVGHSERRADHGETDEQIAAKATAAIKAGLQAIVCIGETEDERNAGQALEVCRRQLKGSLPTGASANTVIVAYEPVWAIGTGRTPSAYDVEEVHADIRETLRSLTDDATSVRLLYGGSVKPANAGELLTIDNVDGALVGGASLKAADFVAIGQAATGNG